ncbi:MAG: urease subunit alpha [Rhodospirillaceae bacterium]|nr:urease subunit alpha [Rhodospirillaceae bacterium]
MARISRRAYAAAFGPTTGDRVRLGDTSLLARVEKDHTVYGEELLTGLGKTLRDGLGVDARVTTADGALDVVVQNALIIDPVLGIVKGDIGIIDGRIVGIGKAGNPAVMAGVDPKLIVGPSTKHFMGEGMIVTPGAIDVHAHFIQPAEVWHALSVGMTTMIGGGFPGCWSVDSGGLWANSRMLKATERYPMNFGLFSRGSSHRPAAIAEQIRSGVIGVKIHEDIGAMPATIDCCLGVADDMDFQVQLHTDTMNEAGFYERTMEAIAGRAIHMYHTEGAGGGHAPDIIRCNGEANCLPSSTTPTNPFTLNAFDEHVDMMMLCHSLSPDVPEDVAFAGSRLRPQTMAAEDVLHDLGAISMFGSDAEGMGRTMEVVASCWKLASKMRDERGPLPGEPFGNADNARILRYLAKITINPAITFGIADHVGSLEPGKMADFVMWQPAFFGIKPSLVVKAGMLVWGAYGDAAAALGGLEPVLMRENWGAVGTAPNMLSAAFVHPSAIDDDIAGRFDIAKPLLPLSGTRKLSKRDMRLNDALPDIRVNSQTFDVFVDGTLATSEPAREVKLNRLYMLR